jgi:hypothetical protein
MQTCVVPSTGEMSALDAPSHDACANEPDPWAQTLRLLEILRSRAQQETSRAIPKSRCKTAAGEDCASSSRPRARPRREAASCRDVSASVTLVERLSATTVVLRWCSCHCHYGDQVWIRRTASTAGICAVTGNLIRRGETVYRPQGRRRVPLLNADAMIHPSAFA